MPVKRPNSYIRPALVKTAKPCFRCVPNQKVIPIGMCCAKLGPGDKPMIPFGPGGKPMISAGKYHFKSFLVISAYPP